MGNIFSSLNIPYRTPVKPRTIIDTELFDEIRINLLNNDIGSNIRSECLILHLILQLSDVRPQKTEINIMKHVTETMSHSFSGNYDAKKYADEKINEYKNATISNLAVDLVEADDIYYLKVAIPGITKDDVYTIDSCGRGEVLVISSTGKDSASKELANRFKVLYENTIQLAKKTCKESWITIPVPYGDNAGFMALGIPAVAITLLPKDEATSYMRELQKHNKIYQNILNRDEEVANILPETWKMMHTNQDSIENLTPESWLVMEKFLDSLANDKSLA